MWYGVCAVNQQLTFSIVTDRRSKCSNCCHIGLSTANASIISSDRGLLGMQTICNNFYLQGKAG